MTTLARYLGTPVDIEFAHDGEDFYLLQCRPQAMTGEAAPAPIPRDIDQDKVVFTARKYVSNGWVPDISHIVYVVPEEYGKLATAEQMKEVGRVVGRLNATLPKRKFILMGPGRWGSRGDIKLGVSISYSDINNTAMLIEIARRTGNYVPDLSFGTHFFQDLVEAQIRYLPLYPDEEDVAFSEDFLLNSDNLLAELLPENADLANCVRVIDVPAVTGGQVLRVFMNSDQDKAVALLDEGGEERSAPAPTANAGEYEPLQFWRWRFRMAERMIRAMEAPRFGVEAVYLFGSVKNGTATPESDINLLVHFRGDEKQRELLDHWFRGWSQALTEMNYSRTGVRVQKMLDVTYLSDEEVTAGVGVAAKINAVTDAARMLKLS